MGQISLQIPQSGQPNSTEDPKVATDLSTIQTVINGNLDDTNMASPNNGVRRLLLGTWGLFQSATAAGTYWFTTFSGQAVLSGSSATTGPQIWLGDSGWSSQPQDFQVAGKTAYGRVRVGALTNSPAPGVTFTWGLYPISALGGTGGSLAVTLGTVVGGSTAAVTASTPDIAIGVESAQFSLPTAPAAYLLGCVVSGTMASGCVLSFNAQLYGYNA